MTADERARMKNSLTTGMRRNKMMRSTVVFTASFNTAISIFRNHINHRDWTKMNNISTDPLGEPTQMCQCVIETP